MRPNIMFVLSSFSALFLSLASLFSGPSEAIRINGGNDLGVARCNLCELIMNDIDQRMVATPIGQTPKLRGKDSVRADSAAKLARANEIVDATCHTHVDLVEDKHYCEEIVEELETSLVKYVLSGKVDTEMKKKLCKTFCHLNKFDIVKDAIRGSVDSMTKEAKHYTEPKQKVPKRKLPPKNRRQEGATQNQPMTSWEEILELSVEYWWIHVCALLFLGFVFFTTLQVARGWKKVKKMS